MDLGHARVRARWLAGLAAATLGLATIACGSDGTSDLSGSYRLGPGAGGVSTGHGASSGGGGGGGGGGGSLQCLNSEVACNDVCVDTSKDPANCGSCGATCGGTCALGHCSITLVPAGGTPVAGGGGIAVSATDAYFVGAGGLMSVPLAGGKTTTIDAHGGNAVAVDATSVYYFGASGLMSLPFAGGQTQVLAPGIGNAIAVGASGACWASLDEGAVSCVSFAPVPDGGTKALLTASENSPGGVAGNATTVFWTNGGMVSTSGGLAPLSGSIGHMSLGEMPDGGADAGDDGGSAPDGGDATTLVSGQNDPVAIALDATNVYWTNAGTTANRYTDGAIMMVPLHGGTPTTLATSQNSPGAIAVDGANVYWTTAGTPANQYADGAVLRVPVGGGTPTVLASGQTNPRGIALDGANLYWTTSTGGVLKMAK